VIFVFRIMLGYTQPSGDVYIFFEEDEVERLGQEKILGTYFNFNDSSKTCLLEASVDDAIDNLTVARGVGDGSDFIEEFCVKMRRSVYSRFKELGSFEDHQGFRHVCLCDAGELSSGFEQMNYEQLKYIRRREGF